MLQEDRGSCRASLEWEHSLCALEMIALLLFSALLCAQAAAWGIRDGVLHNSIWLGKRSFLSLSPTPGCRVAGFVQQGKDELPAPRAEPNSALKLMEITLPAE